MATESKKKCRQYSVEYLKMGFISSPANPLLPMCLLCQKSFTNEAMQPSRLNDHFIRAHPDKNDKSLDYFQNLRDKQLQRPTVSGMFSKASKRDDDGLRASYNISLMIAKSGKPHTIGEDLIIPAIGEVLATVLHIPAYDVLKKIPLSNSTVQRRIDDMAADVETNLCTFLKTAKFSLQIDESTLPNNDALLLAYVRFVRDGDLWQEMLFAKCLQTDTRGESIFNVVNNFLTEKGIPLDNILSVATDGAPAMVGKYRGFNAHLKNRVPNVLTIHCLIHRQHLVARNLSERLHRSMQLAINGINKIKANALNSRIFEQLCDKNDDEFKRLILHTEVRWLSKGNCLKRFFHLLPTILEFFADKDPGLMQNLINSKHDLAYLSDLYAKFNEINLQLQGDELNLIKSKNVVTAFAAKLRLYKQNIGRKEFKQFLTLKEIHDETGIDDESILVYCNHLKSLTEDFTERFRDILELNVPAWIIDPFQNVEKISVDLQEDLIDIISNEELKVKFAQGYQQFWIQPTIAKCYPNLWSTVEVFFIAFPSSYLAERGFSAVMQLVDNQRNRLEVSKRGDLRLKLTKIKPNIDKLITSALQLHPSH